MTEYKVYKTKSKEYRQYIDGVINEYNTNGKKTLLFVVDNAYPLVDGVWRVLDNCTAILHDMYPQYNVVIMGPEYYGEVYVKDIPFLPVHSRYLKSLHYQLALPQFDSQAKKWLKKLRIDLIHCHSPFFCGLMARKLHLKRKIPMVTTFHSQFKKDFLKATKSKALTRLGLKIIMKVFNSSDEVWTMHHASRDTLYSYGFKGKCRLMPNATGMKPLENYQEVRDAFRIEHNVQDKVVLIFVGRLITQKGILFILDVLNILKQNGTNFKMFFVGDGPDEKKLKAKIRSSMLTDEVEMVGNLNDSEEMARYYAGADLFLFPSMYDVSSIVQIEAATYKTPTVFAEGSVTSCVVRNNVNGYLLPLDAKLYAQGVEDILKSNSMCQVGENALRDLHLEWEDIVAKSVDIYENLISQRTVKTKQTEC